MKTLTLRAARKRANLTQDELAAKSGIDQTTISRLERGPRANPTFDTVTRLVRALGLGPVQLRFPSPKPASISTRGEDRVGHSHVETR